MTELPAVGSLIQGKQDGYWFVGKVVTNFLSVGATTVEVLDTDSPEWVKGVEHIDTDTKGLKPCKLRQTTPMHLTAGKRFYLSEKGDFPEVMKEWHGYRTRMKRDPETGDLTGERERCLVYTCEEDYKDEIPVDFPIWVKD